MSLKNASFKAAIVLIPSYTVAFLTEQMVYVVPMLAATSFFAGTIDLRDANIQRRIDEDGEAQDNGENDLESETEASSNHLVSPQDDG